MSRLFVFVLAFSLSIAGCYQPPFDLNNSLAAFIMGNLHPEGGFSGISINKSNHAWTGFFVPARMSSPTEGYLVLDSGAGDYEIYYVVKEGSGTRVSIKKSFSTDRPDYEPCFTIGTDPSMLPLVVFPISNSIPAKLFSRMQATNTITISDTTWSGTTPTAFYGGGVSIDTSGTNLDFVVLTWDSTYTLQALTSPIPLSTISLGSINIGATQLAASEPTLLSRQGRMAWNGSGPVYYSFLDDDTAKTYQWPSIIANPTLTKSSQKGIVRTYLSNGNVVFDDVDMTYFYQTDGTLISTVPKGDFRFVHEFQDAGLVWRCLFSVVAIIPGDGFLGITVDLYSIPTSELSKLNF